MPIEVHCPNPVCARVHLVKNRYAGMRGKCPACNSWMYVPQQGAMPSMIGPRPEELEQLAKRKKNGKPVVEDFDEGVGKPTLLEDAMPPPKKAAAKSKAKPAPAEDEPVMATLEDDEPAKPKRRFSWLAAALVFLGMLSLGAVSASPYLQPPTDQAASAVAKNVGEKARGGINEAEFAPFIQIAPACVAGGALLTLLTAFITRRFAFPSVFLLYLTTIGSAVLVLLLLSIYRDEMSHLDTRIRTRESSPNSAQKIDKGQQLYALGGGTVGAAAMFVLAIVVVHRRWWSKLLGFVFVAALMGVAGVYVYREPLGLKEYFPDEQQLLEKLTIPF